MAGFLDTLFGGGAEKEAADKNRAALGQYSTDAMGYLKSGYDTGTTDLNKAVDAYSPLAALGTKYGKAGDTYLDALGVNGPEGAARAQSQFTEAPGYQYQVGQATDAIDRRRAIGGMYSSGNADIDTNNAVQGLANQGYSSWLQNLAGAGQTGVAATGTAAAGQAGGYGSLANLASQYSQNQTGVAGNVTSGNISANNLQAAGEAAGAKNLLGAGLGLLSLGAGGGLGSLGSSLMGGIGSSLGSLGVTYGMPGTAGSNLFGPKAPGT
jgi:hypothetical protein